MIQRTVECHAAAAAQKGVQLRAARPEGTLPLVEGSEAMLQRAVNVLVDNAVCYTPAGGHIKVFAQRQGRNVALIVEDDGPGNRSGAPRAHLRALLPHRKKPHRPRAQRAGAERRPQHRGKPWRQSGLRPREAPRKPVQHRAAGR